jgi:hypothetical protein
VLLQEQFQCVTVKLPVELPVELPHTSSSCFAAPAVWDGGCHSPHPPIPPPTPPPTHPPPRPASSSLCASHLLLISAFML